MAVEVAREVLEPDEVGEPGRQGGLDLTMVLAQLGLDEREPEEGVGIVFRGERPQLGVVAAERLAALTDAQETLLGQAPAHVPGALAETDVVLLRSGEVDAVRAGGPGGITIRSTCGPRSTRTAAL